MAQSAASYFAPVGSSSPADLLRQPSRTARATPEPAFQSGSEPLSAFEPTFRQKVRQDRDDERSPLSEPSDRTAPEKEREATDRAPASEDESANDADPRDSGAAEAQESLGSEVVPDRFDESGESQELFEIAPVGSAPAKLPAATLSTNQAPSADAKPAAPAVTAAPADPAAAEPLAPIDPRTGLPLPGRADVRRELKAAETSLGATLSGAAGDDAAAAPSGSASAAAPFEPLASAGTRTARANRPTASLTGSERAASAIETPINTDQGGAPAQEQPGPSASVLRQSVEAERAAGASQSRGDGQSSGGSHTPQHQSFQAFAPPGHAAVAPDAPGARAAGDSSAQATDGAGKGAPAIKGAETGVFQLKQGDASSPRLGVGGARGAEPGQARPGASNPQPDGAAGMVARGLSASVLQRGGTMNISLIPETLGQVRVEMTLDRGVVGVSLEASSAAAQDLLEGSLPMLRSTLESKGLSVERLSVHLSPQAAVASGSGGADGASAESKDQNSASQPGSRGSLSDHDAGGGASRGRREGEHGQGSFAGGSGGSESDTGGARDSSPLTTFRLALNAIA
jgi:flagellar hook-length control protein FliK